MSSKTTIRFDDATKQRLNWLKRERYGSLTKIYTIAIKDLYEKEKEMTRLNRMQENILEQTGANDWNTIVAKFGELEHDEVLEILNEMFPSEDNSELAHDIVLELEDWRETVEAFDYRDVEIFVDRRVDGFYTYYENSQDVGPFDTIEEAEQAGRYMRDAHDER